jgi:hypothetical protein
VIRPHFGDRRIGIAQRPHGQHHVVFRVKTIAKQLAQTAQTHRR